MSHIEHNTEAMVEKALEPLLTINILSYSGGCHVNPEKLKEVVVKLLLSEKERVVKVIEGMKENAQNYPMLNKDGEMVDWNNGYRAAMNQVLKSLSTIKEEHNHKGRLILQNGKEIYDAFNEDGSKCEQCSYVNNLCFTCKQIIKEDE